MPNKRPKFDAARAARVLAEAVATGDAAAAKRHGVAERTIRHWRKKLEGDPVLAGLCQEKVAIVEADWAESLPSAIRKCIEFLADATEKCDARSPEAVHAIAGAMKLLTDVALARQMLDVRLARQAGQAGAANGAPPGSGSGSNVLALRPARPVADGVHPGGEQKISGTDAPRAPR
ncbi:MAG TPA: hypothetical protein VGH28_13910 [Polyangiaceae bacterium]|jgi:hypothetical protein